MKTNVHPHPLKDIILEFDESKEQLDIEKEAVALYYQAHDEVWNLKQRLDYLANGIMDANDAIYERQAEALAFDQSLAFVEDSLGLSDGSDIPEIEDEITIDVTGLFQEMEEHSDKMGQLYEQIEDLTKRYNYEIDLIDPEDEYQDNWPVHSRFFGLFREIYQRYEEVSINIVSVDDDEQEFLGIYGDLFDAYRANLDFAEEVFSAYALLIERINPLYSRAATAMAAMNQKMRRDLGGE